MGSLGELVDPSRDHLDRRQISMKGWSDSTSYEEAEVRARDSSKKYRHGKDRERADSRSFQ